MQIGPRILILILSVTAGINASPRHALAQEQETAAEPLTVATKEAPPFAMKDAQGNWSGLVLDAWDDLARRLDLDYRLLEATLPDMLDGVAGGRFDLAVAAITITDERERRLDFSHPYYTTGLGMAVRKEAGNTWLAAAKGLLSPRFLGIVGLLAAVLLGVGALAWVFERKANPDQFGGPPSKGIGSGFWWAAVTMTTVGYGDKAPTTVPGRILGLIWMFTALLLVASFTGAIASALTTRSLTTAIHGPEDLPAVRVATVADTASEHFLTERGLAYRTYPTLAASLDALATTKVDAVVHDRPLLQHMTHGRDGLTVLPQIMGRQDYGIALGTESPLREPLNRALLSYLKTPAWRALVDRYLPERRPTTIP